MFEVFFKVSICLTSLLNANILASNTTKTKDYIKLHIHLPMDDSLELKQNESEYLETPNNKTVDLTDKTLDSYEVYEPFHFPMNESQENNSSVEMTDQDYMNDYQDDFATDYETNVLNETNENDNKRNVSESTLESVNWMRRWWVEHREGSQDVSGDNIGCGIVPRSLLRQSQNEGRNRIIGGKTATPHNWPWVVRLIGGCSNGYCGASLVSHRHIVTSYHCALAHKKKRPCDHSDGRTLAYFGIHTFIESEIDSYYSIPVIDFKYPPNAYLKIYDYDSHDFALGILAKDVKFSDFIRPICIPKQGMDFSGQMGIAAGWGMTSSEGDGSQSPVLKDAYLRVSMTKFNHYKMFGTEVIRNGKIQDPCSGDSGGPLMWRSPAGRYVLIGTVFGGGYNCNTGKIAKLEGSDDGIWNKVSFHSDWIKETMRETGTGNKLRESSSHFDNFIRYPK